MTELREIKANRRTILAYAASAFALPTLARAAGKLAPALPIAIGKNGIRIEFDTMMRTRVASLIGGKVTAITDFGESEYLVVDNDRKETLFVFISARSHAINDARGKGIRHIITGEVSDGMEKTITLTIHDRAPTLAAMQVSYRNIGRLPVMVKKWVNGAHLLATGKERSPSFWSWHGASHEDRRDWIRPIDPGFEQRNYMGMNASDYGSGTPMVDVWRRDAGLAIGHLETVPKLVSNMNMKRLLSSKSARVCRLSKHSSRFIRETVSRRLPRTARRWLTRGSNPLQSPPHPMNQFGALGAMIVISEPRRSSRHCQKRRLSASNGQGLMMAGRRPKVIGI
jgi:hypothetical protein